MTFHSPWDQPVYKKAKRKKAKKKSKAKPPDRKKVKKKVAKRVPRKKVSRRRGPEPQTLRAPCGIRDPQADEIEVAAKIEDLRRGLQGHKKKTPWPKDAAYMTVAFGGGVDSSAMLVGLNQLWIDTRDERWVPKVVVFADVGAEVPETYAWIKRMDKWLRDKAFKGASVRPTGVTKVCYATEQLPPVGKREGSWGSAYTLEQQMLNNHSMPPPSFTSHGHTCAITWKVSPQKLWFEQAIGNDPALPLPPGNKKVLKAVGFDCTEVSRKTKGSGYAEKAGGIYKPWFPLIDWGWDRVRCLAEICLEMGAAPRKSSCFFCGSMKASELRMLAEDHPDLLERAIFMEQLSVIGRLAPRKRSTGLGRGFRWTDFALGDLTVPGMKDSPLRQAHLIGGVVKTHPTKQTVSKKTLGSRGVWDDNSNAFVAWIPRGGGKPIELRKNEHYIPPAKIRGLPPGQFISEKRVKELIALAKEWWASSPPESKRGDPEWDMSMDPLTNRVPAFKKVLGFRTMKKCPFAYDRLIENILEAEDEGDRLTVRKGERLLKMARRGSVIKNPGRVSAPVSPSGLPRSPLEAGI